MRGIVKEKLLVAEENQAYTSIWHERNDDQLMRRV